MYRSWGVMVVKVGVEELEAGELGVAVLGVGELGVEVLGVGVLEVAELEAGELEVEVEVLEVGELGVEVLEVRVLGVEAKHNWPCDAAANGRDTTQNQSTTCIIIMLLYDRASIAVKINAIHVCITERMHPLNEMCECEHIAGACIPWYTSIYIFCT